MVTCLYQRDNHVLLLQKPKRGWWSCPGGKMEPAETILETVHREFREETGLDVIAPQLRGVFTVVVSGPAEPPQEWMHFFFYARAASGQLVTESQEGKLAWHPVDQLHHLPMAEGDRLILQHVLRHDQLLVGRFHYTSDFQLLDYSLVEAEQPQYVPSSK
ncbi:MAG: 8-oxo-dGTP diphosphatase [Bacillota bacterium]